jgi:uncharacterized membrane protein
MTTYQWLLFIHVTGAFVLIGGTVVAGAFNLAAQTRERPSEVALLYGLTRFAVIAIILGALITLVFGLWLVDEAPAGYHYSQGWIIAALILWVVAMAAGGRGGRRERETHEFASKLAAEGDQPSADLKARMRDPVSLTLSYGSGIVILAMLAIMIWKPGA